MLLLPQELFVVSLDADKFLVKIIYLCPMARQRSILFLLIFLSGIHLTFAQSRMLDLTGTSRSGEKKGGELEHQHDDHSEQSVKSNVMFFKAYADNLDTFQIAVDTFLHQTHNYNPMYRESISAITLGNLGSPYISNLYFDRPESDFFFSDVYHAFYKNKKSLPYINTKTPFTVLNYNNGGPKYYAEEALNGLFSYNAGEAFNFGGYFDLIYGRGRYTDQSTRHKNFGAFASYSQDKYSAFFNIGTSVMENYENGGLGNSSMWLDSIITNPSTGLSADPENFSMRLQDDDARSYARNRFISLRQKYNIGVTREVPLDDTVATEFVPALNLIHQFEISADVKQYEDAVGMSSYYDTAYIYSTLTTDSVRQRRISNRVGLYLDERINQFGKFGLGGYLQMDNVKISQNPWHMIPDSSLVKTYSNLMADDSDIALDSARFDFIHNYEAYTYTNISLGASMFKRYGSHFFFDASANIYMSGYNAGDWQVKGELRQVFPEMGNWELSGRVDFQRKTPQYFYQHYYGNNFWWNNDFDASFHQKLGGTLAIPAIHFSLSVDVDNMQNHLFFNEQALPQQYANNMTVMAVRLKKDFEIGQHLVWENDVVYQETSASEALPLPQLTVYSNFYFRHILFKVLHFELGVDGRYYTSYYAPGYMPATGRFYNQRDVEIGNYPVMNAYADFFLRRMRFFVMYQHFNQGWPSLEYYSAPHYPYNPRQIKFGLNWTFYD